MNLRKEIEQLIYWYLPAITIALLSDIALSAYIKASNDSSSIVVWSYLGIGILISHLHHLVIAIWLYSVAKRMNQKYILWSLFGLMAHLFAAVIFLVLCFYDKNNQNETDKKVGKKLFIWSK